MCFIECTFLLQIDENSSMAVSRNTNPPDYLVGDVNLFMHDHEDRSIAEIEVMIALEAYRKCGLGYKALCCLMTYGVKHLGITKFFSKISSTNESSIALFKK